jgi:hypothetical protein
MEGVQEKGFGRAGGRSGIFYLGHGHRRRLQCMQQWERILVEADARAPEQKYPFSLRTPPHLARLKAHEVLVLHIPNVIIVPFDLIPFAAAAEQCPVFAFGPR